MRATAPGEKGHVAYTFSFRFLIHGSGMRCIQCQRLFTDHMQSSIKRIHGQSIVLIIGCANHNRMQTAARNHVSVIGKDGRYPILGCHGLSVVTIAPTDCSHLYPWVSLQHWQMCIVHPPTRSNETNTN